MGNLPLTLGAGRRRQDAPVLDGHLLMLLSQVLRNKRRALARGALGQGMEMDASEEVAGGRQRRGSCKMGASLPPAAGP